MPTPIPLRVLIAEDSPDDAELLVLLLLRGGYAPHVKRVQTAEEMRAAFAEGPWDVVLSDFSMPGFGAIPALAICREVDPNLPFIVASGTIGEEQAVEMMRAGANDYLLKGKLTRLVPVVVRELREAESRRAKLRMEQEISRLAAIVDSSEDAIVSADIDGCVQTWNPGAERLFGYSAAEAIGQSDFLVPPHLKAEFHDIGRRLHRHEQIPAFETIRLRKGGEAIEVSLAISPILVDGQFVARSAIYRNITEQKRAQQTLRESQELLRAQSHLLQSILHNMSDGVVVANEQGKFILFNPAAEQILNQGAIDAEPGEWQERFNLYQLDGITPYPTEDLPLVKALRDEPTDSVEMIVMDDRLPEPRWISVNGRPMRNGVGRLLGGIVVFRNITERKRNEHALRASEERYRTLVSATSAIIWDSPPSGEFDSEQPAWTAFTGQTLQEHRGGGWLNAVHPDDREKSARAWADAVANRSVYQVEQRLRRADGEYRQMSVRAVPIFEPSGAIREWVGVHTDETDQKKTEAERADLLAQLTMQIERMPLAYLLSGPDFRFIHWNTAAEQMFGFAAGEVFGTHPSENIVPPQSEAIVADIFVRLQNGDMNAHGLCENMTKDGTLIVCEWHNTPLFGSDGAFQGIFSLAQDVTKRRYAEQALREAQQRLKHVLASSPAILFTLKVEDERVREINWISDNVQELLGYSTEDATGSGWWLRNLYPQDREEFNSQLRMALWSKGHMTHEYRFRHQNGGYVWTRGDLRVIRDATGQPVEVIGAWSDITARKLLEDQYHQAQKMDAFGQLAGGVAHDFNNLLTIINGYSEMLIQRLTKNDPNRKLLSEIHKAGERSAGLTRQLLAFSRQQILTPQIIQLNEVVKDTDRMLRRLIGEDVRLTTTLDSHPWAVRADPGQIEQVLLNLAVNARDAMPEGGRLTIETRNTELDEMYVRIRKDARPGPHVVLSVTDTGTGIPPEVMTKIFEPFFTTKAQGKGTGLGLATVYGIVKQSGGHVSVYSEMGIGTTFKVYLPRVEEALTNSKPPSRNLPAPRGTETILVAEDEVGVRTLTKHILTECGYTVLEAIDGEDAIRVAAAHAGPIHLLITDVVMPSLGGRAVAQQLNHQHPDMGVLFVSGYTDDAIIRHGVLREGMNFLQKPFAPIALAVKVRDVLDAPAPNSGRSNSANFH